MVAPSVHEQLRESARLLGFRPKPCSARREYSRSSATRLQVERDNVWRGICRLLSGRSPDCHHWGTDAPAYGSRATSVGLSTVCGVTGGGLSRYVSSGSALVASDDPRPVAIALAPNKMKAPRTTTPPRRMSRCPVSMPNPTQAMATIATDVAKLPSNVCSIHATAVPKTLAAGGSASELEKGCKIKVSACRIVNASFVDYHKRPVEGSHALRRAARPLAQSSSTSCPARS